MGVRGRGWTGSAPRVGYVDTDDAGLEGGIEGGEGTGNEEGWGGRREINGHGRAKRSWIEMGG